MLKFVGGGSHCTGVQAEGMPDYAWAMAFFRTSLMALIIYIGFMH